MRPQWPPQRSTQSIPEEITGSLAAVWKRYTSKRPESGTTEIKGNVVRCVMPASAESFATSMKTPPEENHDDRDPASRLVSYRRDAALVVSRSTHCRVLAQMSEHDAKTDVATEIFVLDIDAEAGGVRRAGLDRFVVHRGP